MQRNFSRGLCLLFVVSGVAPLFAWDYEGHRTINQLALASLPADFPLFVKTAGARERIAFLSGEPDRWRNSRDHAFRHVADPDHYIDLEELSEAGLSFEKLSEFRYVFSDQWMRARAAHSDRFPAIDPNKNKDHTRELAGFLPWAINEACAKLKSKFSCLKAFEELGSKNEIANAQDSIIQQMGEMGHLVGDAAQPLHTTKYFNGWNGKNPHGFTTSPSFHSWIDGGYLFKTGAVRVDRISARLKPAQVLIPPADAAGRDLMFVAIFNYVLAQHAKVKPLYELEKSGRLTGEGELGREGKIFLEDQFLAAGHMLGSLWLTAWREAPPDTYLRARLLERKALSTPAKP